MIVADINSAKSNELEITLAFAANVFAELQLDTLGWDLKKLYVREVTESLVRYWLHVPASVSLDTIVLFPGTSQCGHIESRRI